jgi:Na+/phosphate symporter
MSKTPYELRLDVLAMAKESLENKQTSRTTNLAALSRLAETDDDHAKRYALAKLKSLPDEKEITTEDILKEADKLYGFVQNNNKKETK